MPAVEQTDCVGKIVTDINDSCALANFKQEQGLCPPFGVRLRDVNEMSMKSGRCLGRCHPRPSTTLLPSRPMEMAAFVLWLLLLAPLTVSAAFQGRNHPPSKVSSLQHSPRFAPHTISKYSSHSADDIPRTSAGEAKCTILLSCVPMTIKVRVFFPVLPHLTHFSRARSV